MKQLYALLAALVFTLPSSAQISIAAAEMPHANDELIRVRAVNNPFLDYAATGAAHTWEFPNLAVAQGDTTAYQTVASTNFIYAIIYADLFFNANRANHAKPGVDIPFSNLLPIANPYTFRYRSNSVYKTVGYGVELSGIPVPILFDEQDVIYELPLEYGDASTSNSSYHIDIPNLGYYGFEQERVNEVDGWGAITTPGGSWDVLRVKTTLTMRDSLSGFAINRPVAREYKWLAQGLRVPVLQVNTTSIFGNEVITGIWYYDVPRTITVDEPLAATLCPGAELDVYYTATGSYNAGGFFIPANEFTAELSDASGSFANPVVIGSVQSTESGSIAATIPANTPPGSGYRIRVVSRSPDYIGASSPMSITIGGATTAAITADGPTQLCEGGSVTLTAVGGPGYQWYIDGTMIADAEEATLSTDLAGDYTVMVSNGCGSATSNTITVAVNAAPELSVAVNSVTVCAGSTALLEAMDLSSEPGTTYQWFLNDAPIAGAEALMTMAALEGLYTMQATSAAGCASTSEGIFLSVETMDATVLTAGGPATFCEGGSVELTATNAMGIAYTWSLDGTVIDGATDATLTADAAGNYTVTATSSNGCVSAPSGIDVIVNLAPNAPSVTANGATAFCAGGTVQLSTDGSGGDVQWYLDGSAIPGATSAVLDVNAGGSYTAIITSAEGCASQASASIDVTVSPLPVAPNVISSEPTAFCAGGGTTLIADFIDGLEYQWLLNGVSIPGATSTQYSTQIGGTYTLLVTNASGCSTMGAPAIEITVFDAPDQPVISQGVDGLEASGTGTFQWYLDGAPINGATSAFYEPTEDGYYTVLITDANGCSSLSEAWFFLTTGVSESNPHEVRLVPNPSVGRFFIEGASAASGYEVHDLTGKLVRIGRITASRTAIDMSDAADGAYFLRTIGGSGEVIRFIIAR